MHYAHIMWKWHGATAQAILRHVTRRSQKSTTYWLICYLFANYDQQSSKLYIQRTFNIPYPARIACSIILSTSGTCLGSILINWNWVPLWTIRTGRRSLDAICNVFSSTCKQMVLWFTCYLTDCNDILKELPIWQILVKPKPSQTSCSCMLAVCLCMFAV